MDEFFRQASRTFFFEPSNGGYPANLNICPSTSGLPDPEPCDTTTGSSEAPSTQTKLPAFTEYTLVIDRKAANRMRHLIPLQPLCVGPNGRKPECDICLSEYESGHKLRHLPCGHGFHQKCIDTWLSSADTCPKCRKNVVGTLRRLESAETRLRSQSKGRPLPASMRQPPASRATSAAGNTGDSLAEQRRTTSQTSTSTPSTSAAVKPTTLRGSKAQSMPPLPKPQAAHTSSTPPLNTTSSQVADCSETQVELASESVDISLPIVPVPPRPPRRVLHVADRIAGGPEESRGGCAEALPVHAAPRGEPVRATVRVHAHAHPSPPHPLRLVVVPPPPIHYSLLINPATDTSAVV
ncbi:unnamed protein product [Mesocestoides corti]|uniref:RING-type domain-containing protein n=1 Tax=Mesocestoides corti TaxID=53468 RepID=A0A0R3UIQ5_MESCO|nr:unnamed protein product [Mesocestoides corti]